MLLRADSTHLPYAPNCSRRCAAYSMVEMLVVALILVTLIALLLPIFSSTRRTAYIATCALQQKQIHQAFIEYKQDHDDKVAFSTHVWPYQLAEYLDIDKPSLACPEVFGDDGDSHDGYGGEWFFGKKRWGQYIWHDMETGIFSRKMSATQFADVVKRFGDKDRSWSPYFSSENGTSLYVQEGGYLPDGSGEFYVSVEDAGWPNVPAGDQDFNDMIVHIKNNPDGKSVVRARRWGGAHYLSYGEKKEDFFERNEPYNWPQGEWTEWRNLFDTNFSYGMNEYAEQIEDKKVFLMDYAMTAIKLDPVDGHDWMSFMNEDGNLSFARHLGETVNTLFIDGSVTLLDPLTIDPSFSIQRKLYWAEEE